MIKKVFLTVFLMIFMALPARADLPDVKDASVQARRVEAYLNGLTTAQAHFVQTTNDGTQMSGTFYLSRPGKLRFEYDDPIKDFVVADGFFIYFYDAELGEQTNAPIGQTLADFMLRDKIKLSGDIKVDHIKRGGGYLQVALSQAEDPGAGGLLLALHENPDDNTLNLKKWRVVDAQGMITEVELFDLKTGAALNSSLFVYQDPVHGSKKKPYNN